MQLTKGGYNKITIHHSASSKNTTKSDILKWHKARGFGDIGYHFLIFPDGHAEKGRPLKYMGAHVYGKNQNNLAICLIGNFEKEPPTPEQYNTLNAMLLALMTTYQIPRYNVFTHRELAATLCPGKYFDKQKALGSL